MIEPLPKTRPRPHVGPPETAPTAYVYADVVDELRFNGRWDDGRIAGGLLVGAHFKDPDSDRSYVEIEGFVGGTHCEDSQAFLKYLRLHWKAAGGALRQHFPESEVVGWYVSWAGAARPWGQPELLLHNTFFNYPWQVGLWVPGGEGAARCLSGRGDRFEDSLAATLDDSRNPAPTRAPEGSAQVSDPDGEEPPSGGVDTARSSD